MLIRDKIIYRFTKFFMVATLIFNGLYQIEGVVLSPGWNLKSLSTFLKISGPNQKV